MNNNINTITASKFLTNYLGVNLDYSKKKITHAKIQEILREYGLDELVCNYHVEDEDIFNGNVLCVIDQSGKLKLYKNPGDLCFKTSYVDSEMLKMELEKKQEKLHDLMKQKISDLSILSYHLKNINKLNAEISLLEEEILLFKANELLMQSERDSYNEKIKRKKNDKYGKHKRKRNFK